MSVSKQTILADLDKVIEILGPEGEHWVQGVFELRHPEYGDCFCLMGAISAAIPGVTDGELDRRVHLRGHLRNNLPRSIRNLVEYNDRRSWQSIKKLLLKTKRELS